MSKRKGREEEHEKVGRNEEEKDGGHVMVDMSKKEGGGQEVEVMSTKKEKGGEEQEEISKKKEEGEDDEEKDVDKKIEQEEGGEESRKDEGQDMDTIMQTLDKLVENIVPPTASAKMPPAGEKKRKVGKAISPLSLTRRVKEARWTRAHLPNVKFVKITTDENNFPRGGQFSKKWFSSTLWLGYYRMADRSPKPLSTTRTWDDCALFVCKYMECLSQKSIIGFHFSQADMDIFRGKLAWAIIQEVNEQKAHEMTCE
ncbi:hypothetical protein Taro_032415 [Colocasia esculenta]|uniref:Ubiquitin-like protease family profile domain-containing protein n=1 Tax=Colocasia esculenta TaxID=4460 RepID=A0A843W627_COLES|nr:hypothetical protein [Colocasia esculenta]